MPLPDTLGAVRADAGAWRVLAADGTPLNRTFRGRFNRTDVLPLSRMPALLRLAFVAAEDRRYWDHAGVDWRARVAALWGNMRAGRVVRGASSIGEQVARILAPHAHSYWGHWMAGIDAGRLLRRFGHARMLAFYLNQVPYAARRRGVVQAARYYFAREPGALNPAEQLALAVLVRSPARYDPRRHPRAARRAVDRLAARMHRDGLIDAARVAAIGRAPLRTGRRRLAVEAGPFVVRAMAQARRHGRDAGVVRTTLDASLQVFVQKTLRRRVEALADRGVHDAAALVVDNRSGAVLAWAVAPGGSAYGIDPVRTPRQAGSTLKPFVYALAMARHGWQPERVIMDTPLAERIDTGVHRYRNYSGRHYGRVSLRYALANSLNIPAVRTAQAVGVPAIIELLQEAGFRAFHRSADHYGPAIVLGDGAVTLHDLVQGYATLARHGRFLPLHVLDGVAPPDPKSVLPAPVTSLVADILSDAQARQAEFGIDSVLDLPQPTAVKTGTSSDYHDLWTVGFDDRYTVGVWMGNLDASATDRLTGSAGPAPVWRQIFAHLRAGVPHAGLWRSPALTAVETCEWIGPPPCIQRRDWHLPGAPGAAPKPPVTSAERWSIARPLDGETLAIDPRQPRAAQRLHLVLDTAGNPPERVRWYVDGQAVAASGRPDVAWTLEPGTHHVEARVWPSGNATPRYLGPVSFRVLEAGSAVTP